MKETKSNPKFDDFGEEEDSQYEEMGSDEEMASESDSASDESWETDSESEIPAKEIVKKFLEKAENGEIPELTAEEKENGTSEIDMKKEREMTKGQAF